MRKQFSLFAKAMLAVLVLAGVSKVSRGDSCSVPSYLSTVDWGEYWEWYCDDWWGEEWTDESGWVPYLICEDCIDCRWLPVGWWAEDLIEVPNTVSGHQYEITVYFSDSTSYLYSEVGDGGSIQFTIWFDDGSPCPIYVEALDIECGAVVDFGDVPQYDVINPFSSGPNPIADFYAAYGLSWNAHEVIGGGPDLAPEAAWALIAARLETLIGRQLYEVEKEHIRKTGCVDIARALMRGVIHYGVYRIKQYPMEKYPERDPKWNVKAFSSYAKAKAYQCDAGKREMYIITQGRKWENDTPPVPNPDTGEVSLYSLTPINYIVRMPSPNEDKWFGLSFGQIQNPDVPQTGYVYNDPPPEDFPNTPQLFLKVCIED